MMKKKNTTSRLNKVDYLIFLICSIFAVLMFVLFYMDMNTFSIKQNEEPVAKISFKENTVQKKFDNRNIWEKVSLSCDIYDGDSLRTSVNSKVIASFLQNDTKINLDENSMIQVFINKKKEFIDFIGGEIHIENTSSDIPVIIHAGTKEISILKNSKVTVTAVSSTSSNENSSNAIVTVEEGQVEITDIPDTKSKIENNEKITVNAGFEVELNALNQISKQEEKQIILIQPKKIVIEDIGLDIEHKENINKIAFRPNYWENGRNYLIDFNLSDLLGKYKKIPKGSVVEVNLSANTDKTISKVGVQFAEFDEKDNWHLILHKDTFPIKNETSNFNISSNFYLPEDLINTNKGILNICYDPDILDQVQTLTDFSLSLKVVNRQPSPIKKGYRKEIYIPEIKTMISNWTENGKFYYNGHFSLEPKIIFGDFTSINKNTKIKVSLEGEMTGFPEIEKFSLELADIGSDWTNCFSYDDNLLTVPIKDGTRFSTTHIFKTMKRLESADNAYLSITYDFPDKAKPKGTTATLKNCKLVVEVVE